jgi:hypothetical protein
MDWWPRDPDAFAAALIVVIVLGALALVALGRLLLWVTGWPIWRQLIVNHSAQAGADYGKHGNDAPPRSAPFPQERELEPERELAEQLAPALPAVDGKLYTAEQIAKLQELAREDGAAEALGRLLGRQLLDADDRTAAMELIYGPRGRKHQRVRPQVDAAAASAVPPAAHARLVPINDGDRGHVEL